MGSAQSVADACRALKTLADGVNCGSEAARNDLLTAAGFLEEYAALLKRGEEEALKPENGNTRWTEEEESRLTAEYSRGMKIAELGTVHGRTPSGIVSRLSKLGLLKENDVNGKKRWTAEEEAELIAEFGKGLSLEELAERHKRSLSGIIGRLSKLGLAE